MLRLLLDLFCGRYVRHTNGGFVPFDDPGVLPQPTPVPTAEPGTAPGPAPAAPSHAVNYAGRCNQSGCPDFGTVHHDTWPAGRGRHANNCLFLDDPRHECTTSYGEPIRPGQDCYQSARAETLRSYTQANPDSWLSQVVAHDIPQEAAR